MSGWIPARSKLKNGPVRPLPTWMSSTMNSRSHSWASASRLLEPFDAGDVHATFGLHGLHDDGRGQVEPAGLVLDELPDVVDGVDLGPEVPVEGHRRGVGQRETGAGALERRAGHREGSEGHAVERVRERDDELPARDLAGELERGLHGVRAGGSGELHLEIAHAAGLEDHVVESTEPHRLGRRRHVEGVRDAIGFDVVDQRLLHRRVVVAVVQHPRTCEEVEVLPTVLVVEDASSAPLEDRGERPDVAADLGLVVVERRQIHEDLLEVDTQDKRACFVRWSDSANGPRPSRRRASASRDQWFVTLGCHRRGLPLDPAVALP